MYAIFWKTLFSSLLMVMLWLNIAYAFDVVSIVNPTALNLNYEDYYFGVSSFVDSFKSFFGNQSTGIAGFQQFLTRYGKFIGEIYDTFVSPFTLVGALTKQSGVWEVIGMLFAILTFMNSVIPMLLLILYSIMYIIFLLAFAFNILLFLISFFGGAFATPLPDTSWWDTLPPVLNSAYTII